MGDFNVLLTGAPRSGTTLACHLLNKLPNCVALHEPMNVWTLPELGSTDAMCNTVERFLREMRVSLRDRKTAISKQVDGAIPTNPIGHDLSSNGLRKVDARQGEIRVVKELSDRFLLIVKHPSAFTAILECLNKRFRCFAMIRNPLAILSSWNSIATKHSNGHAPAAERLDKGLAAKLAAIDNPIDRQLRLLAWFFEKHSRVLSDDQVIRYEVLIRSRGKALNVIDAESSRLDQALTDHNTNTLYDRALMTQIGERLLKEGGSFWDFYTKQSVEDLLNRMSSQTN